VERVYGLGMLLWLFVLQFYLNIDVVDFSRLFSQHSEEEEEEKPKKSKKKASSGKKLAVKMTDSAPAKAAKPMKIAAPADDAAFDAAFDNDPFNQPQQAAPSGNTRHKAAPAPEVDPFDADFSKLSTVQFQLLWSRDVTWF